MVKCVMASILIGLGVTACTTSGNNETINTITQYKPRPPLWTVDYGVPFDVMADCLAGPSGEAFTVTRQPAQQSGVATISFLPRNAPQAESGYAVRRMADGTSQVSWQRFGNTGNLDWLDVEARSRANRCGGA